MSNILEAINNITNQSINKLSDKAFARNRANSMGDALETYVKDAFANSFDLDENAKLEAYSKLFSWLGTQNNPPDIMLRGGDAIEVKKTQSYKSSLALNSSYPKSSLKSSNPMITSECRKCENWNEKDLIYAVGHTSDKKIHSIWFIYGSIYAAKEETYARFKDTISQGIKTIPNVVFSETKELGRVNSVDPLGITNLRIRGMWQIENPRKVFEYIHKTNENLFELVAIVPEQKYNSFPEQSRVKIERNKQVSLGNTKVKDPNNPANLISVLVIKYLLSLNK